MIKSRYSIPEFLNDLNLKGEMVEVGVAFGGYAKFFIDGWKGKKIWLVDPYEEQSLEVYRERDKKPYDSWHNQVKAMEDSDSRVKLIRKYSVDASMDFSNDQLDFVYIDGNHEYSHVINDLDSWYPKLKSGGVFAGHDYNNNTDPPHYCEVERALTDWRRANDVLNFSVFDKSPKSFLFFKP